MSEAFFWYSYLLLLWQKRKIQNYQFCIIATCPTQGHDYKVSKWLPESVFWLNTEKTYQSMLTWWWNDSNSVGTQQSRSQSDWHQARENHNRPTDYGGGTTHTQRRETRMRQSEILCPDFYILLCPKWS